jgi:hypothetical protein
VQYCAILCKKMLQNKRYEQLRTTTLRGMKDKRTTKKIQGDGGEMGEETQRQGQKKTRKGQSMVQYCAILCNTESIVQYCAILCHIVQNRLELEAQNLGSWAPQACCCVVGPRKELLALNPAGCVEQALFVQPQGSASVGFSLLYTLCRANSRFLAQNTSLRPALGPRLGTIFNATLGRVECSNLGSATAGGSRNL